MESDRIICRGYCGATFHAICVHVDEPLLTELRQSTKNVFWMCDGCASIFVNAHFRQMMTSFDQRNAILPDAVQSMQAEIGKLHTALNALSEKVDAKPNTPTPFATPNPWFSVNRSNRQLVTPKRRRENNGDAIGVSSESGMVGTKTADVIKTVQIERRPDDNLFWIYLSAFHPSTSENQICSLATECIGIPPDSKPRVVKLIPRGKDISTLNFVSFKVGVAFGFKEKALSCETWPETVRFRQFDDSRSKNVAKIVTLSSAMDLTEPTNLDG